jgi:hypothetical protein
MQILQGVTAKQQRPRRMRFKCVQRKPALFREFEIARIETGPCFGNENPSELLKRRSRLFTLLYPPLEIGNLCGVANIARFFREHNA